MLLAISMNQSSGIKAFKAPVNDMFLIHNTYCAVFSAGSNEIIILGKSLPSTNNAIDVQTENDGMVSVFVADTVGNFEHNLRVPEKVKIISIARGGSNAFGAVIIINYEFVSATKSELLWEFLRNFRR